MQTKLHTEPAEPVIRRKIKMSKIESAGYVVFAGTAIYGAGFTEDECAADARQWVDDPDQVPEVAEIFRGEINQAKMKGDLIMVEASKALVDEVNEFGAPNRWGMIGSIAVTNDEENASE